MATLTSNLFHGRGPFETDLEVIDGHWPEDLDGSVFIVGPDKRAPGGHWFGAHGLLCRIDVRPDGHGRIGVRAAAVDTPMARLRARWPRLFRRIEFAELSPFGVTNMANTNVEPIDGRLFIGYDAGRPLEVDPESMAVVTPVGANREWLQAVPAPVEPLVSVAAHPAPDHDEHALYFVNYSPLPGARNTSIVRWGLDGPLQRWPLDGATTYDSIHDVKASAGHLVVSDLPFVVEPSAFRGGPRTIVNQDVTRLFIVAKADLRTTPPGEPVPVREVEIPLPTGHLTVDHDDHHGVLTVYLEHIPLGDLMIRIRPEDVGSDGAPIDPDFEGFVALGVQPGAVGRYRIDAATGEILDRDVVWDDRFWGGVLTTRDDSTPEARRQHRHLWYVGIGFDPNLVPQRWWDLYHDAPNTSLVPPGELPDQPQPGALAHFDLEAMKVTEIYRYENGAFPSPPTFIPRLGADGPGDGYVLVMVHQDGDKELHLFDAQDIERGPLARASAPGFNPPLLLHSCWMPRRPGARPSRYRVPLWRDLLGTWASAPRTFRTMLGGTRAAIREQRTAKI